MMKAGLHTSLQSSTPLFCSLQIRLAPKLLCLVAAARVGERAGT